MIAKTEIMEFSREFGLSANVIEKDYVLGWVLAERERPRDLYDVIHLFRHEELNPDQALI